MARKGIIENNNRKKRICQKYLTKREDLKKKIYDKNISLEDRFALVLDLSKITRNSAKNRIRNRCELTGRGRGYYRKFKLSRNMLRKFAGFALIPGLKKASW